MKKRFQWPLIAFMTLLTGSVGFAEGTAKSVWGANKSADGSSMMKQEMGQTYQVIDFNKGSAQLSPTAKENLRTLVENAKAKGPIEKIHVAVWSDKSFPKAKGASLPRSDRNLAEQRSKAIESYLDETLKVSDVDTYSMAEGSNWFARAFHTEDAELKSLFAQQGAPANVSAEQFTIVKQKGGPMKAVVLLMMDQTAKPSGASSSGTSSSGSDLGTTGSSEGGSSN